MIRSLVLGSLLGLLSGIVPGPFSALVAATALRRGFWVGVWIALLPLVTETAVVVLTALLVSRLPEGVLRWTGMAGGLFVMYLARRTWKESRSRPAAIAADGSARRITEGALLAILSPAPWVFWILVGAPLLLGAWRQGWQPAAAFLGAFLFFLVGIHVSVAAMGGYGRNKLPPKWRRRLMKGAAVMLAAAGALLVWQSWTGNFQRMATGTETIRSLVGDSLTGPR